MSKEFIPYGMYKSLAEAMESLFIVKNRQYGNHFLTLSRVGMFQEIRRKFKRFEALFEENEDYIKTTGDWSTLIPSLVDLSIYCNLNIIKEIVKFAKDNKYEGYEDEVTEIICKKIIEGVDKIKSEDINIGMLDLELENEINEKEG